MDEHHQDPMSYQQTYHILENERGTEKEDELPLTPGDESLDQLEQGYFSTEELEGENHS